MNAFRRMLDRRRRENVARLALFFAVTPGRQDGWDTSKATGLRTATTHRLLARFLDNGWLRDGWEENPGDRPPLRYYVVTDLGRAELPRLAAGLEATR